MDKGVEEEVLYHILNSFNQEVEPRQLLNMITEVGDGYELRAYGTVLRFNRDGDLL